MKEMLIGLLVGYSGEPIIFEREVNECWKELYEQIGGRRDAQTLQETDQ